MVQRKYYETNFQSYWHSNKKTFVQYIDNGSQENITFNGLNFIPYMQHLWVLQRTHWHRQATRENSGGSTMANNFCYLYTSEYFVIYKTFLKIKGLTLRKFGKLSTTGLQVQKSFKDPLNFEKIKGK